MYKHTLEIKEYKKWLIITVLEYGAKIRNLGTGTLFFNFNRNDLQISLDAYGILKDNIKKNMDQKDPVMEIISYDRIWWASDKGIIIPPNEIFHIFTIPMHTTCNNDVDEKIKKIIDDKK